MAWTDKTQIMDRPWEIYGGSDNFLKIRLLHVNGIGQTLDASKAHQLGLITIEETLEPYEWTATWKGDTRLGTSLHVDYDSNSDETRLLVWADSEQTQTDGSINENGTFIVKGTRNGQTSTLVKGRTTYRKDITNV